MALFEIVTVGILGGLVYRGIKQSQEETKRKKTPFYFSDGISEENFKDIVARSKRNIKRIVSLTSTGPVVKGVVRSQSGISVWSFTIDFNDYGHFSKRYWLNSDNHQSEIPAIVARNIQSEIVRRLAILR